MTERIKPTGEAWGSFVDMWYVGNHQEKVDLCRSYGVTYDTGKHWVSEGTTDPVPAPVTDAQSVEEVDDGVALASELLALPSYIQLDFVSFDLETTGFTADFNTILCACIKPFGQEPMVYRIDEYNPNWVVRRADDVELVRAIRSELSKHAIIITHYGIKFDIPFLQAKMLKNNLPPLPPMFGVDTYSIAKAHFKVASRRLKGLADYLALGKKGDVAGSLWVEAGMNANKEALDMIVKHNIIDCELLEGLAARSFPYLRSIRRL